MSDDKPGGSGKRNLNFSKNSEKSSDAVNRAGFPKKQNFISQYPHVLTPAPTQDSIKAKTNKFYAAQRFLFLTTFKMYQNASKQLR